MRYYPHRFMGAEVKAEINDGVLIAKYNIFGFNLEFHIYPDDNFVFFRLEIWKDFGDGLKVYRVKRKLSKFEYDHNPTFIFKYTALIMLKKLMEKIADEESCPEIKEAN